MTIHPLTPSRVADVARLMSALQPEWWDVAKELRALRSNGRAYFDFFRKIGFAPAGWIPNCYGENDHGIIIIKSLL